MKLLGYILIALMIIAFILYNIGFIFYHILYYMIKFIFRF